MCNRGCAPRSSRRWTPDARRTCLRSCDSSCRIARDVVVADDSVAVLDARHADFLGRIEPALATIDQIASREQGTAALIDLLDCKLPAAALAPPQPARVFPTPLRIQANPEAFDTEPRAHEAINFQLVQAAPDGNGPDTLYDPEDCDLAWRANGEVRLPRGARASRTSSSPGASG